MADHDTPTKDRPATSPAGAADFPNIQQGRYRLISVIGSGGAGTVYRALDTTLDKEVAIKKLHTANNVQAIRFQREAKLAGALKHENVMSARDFGITEKCEPYLILDYVNGESLYSLIQRSGRLTVEEALRISIQIAKGLHHAHSNGVIHRDIKPSNVILVEETDSPGTKIAKIVDFGLAKSINDDQNITQEGVGMGTPQYMSPEHIHGIEIDERSDIYSLGCLIFEVLTGVPPFRGVTAVETFDMHLNDKPPTLESKGIDCSENLERIVASCLDKNPQDRIQTAKRLVDLLTVELEEINQERLLEEAMFSGVSQEIAEGEQPDAIARGKRIITFIALGIGAIAMILWAVLTIIAPADPGVEKRPRQSADFKAMAAQADREIDAREPIYADGFSEDNGMIWCTNHATDADMRTFLTSEGEKGKVLTFDLSESNLTSKGFDLLAKHGDLTKLVYISKPLNDETLTNVAQIQTLTDLRIGDTQTINSSSLKALSGLPHLAVLYIGAVPLDEKAFEELSKLEAVKVLELTGCTGITPAGLKHVMNMKLLEQLKLDGTDVTNEAMETLLQHPRLELVSLKRTAISDALVDRLKEVPSLMVVDLRADENVTEAAIARLKASKKSLTIKSGLEGVGPKGIKLE